MKTYINSYFGQIKGVYLSPADAGFGFAERAIAYLSTDGTFLGYEYQDIKKYNSYERQMLVVGRARVGTQLDDERRGAELSVEVKDKLSSALKAAQDEQQRKIAEELAQLNAQTFDVYGNEVNNG
jgi:UDP-N-acetylglucosamine transferase subunit ALG13